MGSLVRLICPTRSHAAVFVAAILATVFCVVTPLFNSIGYESAALFGVLAGLGAIFSSLAHPELSTVKQLLGPSERTPLQRFGVLFFYAVLPLTIPVAGLSLLGLVITNCDPLVGAAFWVLIPLVSVFNGVVVAMVAAAVFSRPGLRIFAALVLVVASVVATGLHLALQPPIVAFQLFLGYFSGSIYDEALSIPDALVVYRVLNVAFGVAFLAAFEAAWRSRSQRFARVPAGVAVITACVALWGWSERESYGIELNRDTISAELGGQIETENFIIHYPAERGFENRIEEIAEDHEYRYAELKQFFETDPVASSGKKVRSFVYPDRERKGAMMGGRRTQVAKLWLHEIHILWREFGDHMLAHELAHIFTEPFGTGPLKLSSRWGVGINMGLVEGIATAADWPHGTMTPHEAAGALRRMDRAPDLRALIGAGGFWGQSSSRAYTIVGSFIRYVVDTYGIDKLKAAYGHGRFEQVYGKSIDALASEWESFVDGIELDDQVLSRARFIYDRPSIFEKVCARTLAELRRVAREDARRGRIDSAVDVYNRMLGFDPGNAMFRIEFARFLLTENMPDRATAELELLLEDADNPGVRAAALELQGDLMWRESDPAQAKARYRECLSLGLPLNRERFVEVKHAVVDDRVEFKRELAQAYLIDDHDSAIQVYFPAAWVRQSPDDPVANYLLGRRLLKSQHYDRSIEYLERAHAHLEVEVLALENRRMLIEAYYFTGELEEAERFAAALEGSQRSAYRESALEWRRRIAWRARNTVSLKRR